MEAQLLRGYGGSAEHEYILSIIVLKGPKGLGKRSEGNEMLDGLFEIRRVVGRLRFAMIREITKRFQYL